MPESLTEVATRHQVFLEKLKTSQTKVYSQVIPKVDKAIRETVVALGADNVSDITRKDLENTLTSLRRQQVKLFRENDKQFYKELQDLADYEVGFETRSIEQAIGNVNLKRPAAELAYTAALRKPLSATGDLMEPLVKSWSTKHITQVNNAVRKAWVEGHTTAQLIRTIRGTKKNGFKDGILAVSQRHASAVAHTSIQHVASTSRLAVWSRNGDIIKGYRFTATLDGRTSATCRSLDGQEFPLNAGPTPPVHINCRSTTVPVLDDKYDFLDEGATRASKDGYVDANQTYYGWLKNQPKDFQKRVLGKKRYELFTGAGMTADKFAKLNLDKDFTAMTLAEMEAAEPTVFQKPTPKPKPTSQPFSETVTVPSAAEDAKLTKPLRGGVKRAVDNISAVHAMPVNFGAGRIVFRDINKTPTPANLRSAGAWYTTSTGQVTVNWRKATNTSEIPLNIQHEVGHWLDNLLFTKSGYISQYATDKITQHPNGTVRKPLRKLMQRLEKSSSVEALHYYRKTRSGNYYAYMTRKHEIFARAYSQYIAHKTKDIQMLNYIESILKGETKWDAYQHWPLLEFEKNIVPLFDELFDSLGLLKQ